MHPDLPIVKAEKARILVKSYQKKEQYTTTAAQQFYKSNYIKHDQHDVKE